MGGSPAQPDAEQSLSADMVSPITRLTDKWYATQFSALGDIQGHPWAKNKIFLCGVVQAGDLAGNMKPFLNWGTPALWPALQHQTWSRLAGVIVIHVCMHENWRMKHVGPVESYLVVSKYTSVLNKMFQ